MPEKEGGCEGMRQYGSHISYAYFLHGTSLPSTAAGAHDLAAAGGEGKALRIGRDESPKDTQITHS